jgi:hypothetical protein
VTIAHARGLSSARPAGVPGTPAAGQGLCTLTTFGAMEGDLFFPPVLKWYRNPGRPPSQCERL